MSQAKLHIRLEGQHMSIEAPSCMMEGCKNYLMADVTTSAAWEGTTILIQCKNADTGRVYSFIVMDGVFYIDTLSAGRYEVSAQGTKTNYIVTSDTAYLRIDPLPHGVAETLAD